MADLTDDSPNVPIALATEQILRSRPDLSVRTISSFSTSTEGVAGWVKDLKGAHCGKWTWRISERASSTLGCEGSVWISNILENGQLKKGTKDTHDSRSDVSSHGDSSLLMTQIELLRRPQGLFEQQSTHASLKAQFGNDWQLGLMSHILPFVRRRYTSMFVEDR